MTTMIAELYDALISAGAPEDKARKASETVAAYETRFVGLEVKLNKIDSDMALGFSKVQVDFAKVNGEMNLIKWMLGLLLAGVASLVIKAFMA
ncbi:Integrase [uncultured Gammaproteobacteria bacterium]